MIVVCAHSRLSSESGMPFGKPFAFRNKWDGRLEFRRRRAFFRNRILPYSGVLGYILRLAVIRGISTSSGAAASKQSYPGRTGQAPILHQMKCAFDPCTGGSRPALGLASLTGRRRHVSCLGNLLRLEQQTRHTQRDQYLPYS